MRILDLIFPPKCAACGELIENIESDSPFCAVCHAKWEQAKITCHRENAGLATTVYNYSYALQEKGGYSVHLIKYLPKMHDSVESRLIFHLKNNAASRTTRFIAAEFYGLLRESVPMICPGGERHGDTVIAWIPRSRKGKLSQGFDHMERCAKAFGKKLGVPVKPLIIKHGGFGEQKALNSKDRRKNAEQSLRLAKDVDLSSKVIVLIDDIVTTGASVNAASKLLYDGGAGQVIVLTIAATSHEERIIRHPEENFNLF